MLARSWKCCTGVLFARHHTGCHIIMIFAECFSIFHFAMLSQRHLAESVDASSCLASFSTWASGQVHLPNEVEDYYTLASEATFCSSYPSWNSWEKSPKFERITARHVWPSLVCSCLFSHNASAIHEIKVVGSLFAFNYRFFRMFIPSDAVQWVHIRSSIFSCVHTYSHVVNLFTPFSYLRVCMRLLFLHFRLTRQT